MSLLGGGEVAIHIYDTLSTSGKNHIITMYMAQHNAPDFRGGGGQVKLDGRIYVPLPWTKIAFESTYNKNQPDSLEKL